MGLLLALTRRPGEAAGGEKAATSGRTSANGGDGPTTKDRSLSPSPSAQGRAAAAAAEAGMLTALMGLVWPDADSAAKAAGVCRYFAALAAGPLPSLEPFVCNDMLKTALVSLAQVRQGGSFLETLFSRSQVRPHVLITAGIHCGHPG